MPFMAISSNIRIMNASSGMANHAARIFSNNRQRLWASLTEPVNDIGLYSLSKGTFIKDSNPGNILNGFTSYRKHTISFPAIKISQHLIVFCIYLTSDFFEGFASRWECMKIACPVPVLPSTSANDIVYPFRGKVRSPPNRLFINFGKLYARQRETENRERRK